MRQPLQRAGIWLMVLLLLPAASLAAKERTGTICGIVVDESGHGLVRAAVFLMDQPGTDILESTFTDSDGRFQFNGLFPDSYLLSAEKAGYQPAGIGPVSAESGKMSTAPFVLRHAGVVPAVDQAPRRAALQPAMEPAAVTPPEPTGTLAETLAGTNRDALKALDRPDGLSPATHSSAPVAGGFTGDLLIAAAGTEAAGDQSIMMASLAGRALGPTRWTVELTRENNPSLFSSGLGGPLLWRVVRTESAAFELSSMPVSDSGTRLPEQTFRLELAERFTTGDRMNGPGLRSMAAHWDRTGSGDREMGLDLFYAAGLNPDRGTVSGRPALQDENPDQATLLLMGGRIRGSWAASHELFFHWRHGSLNGDPSGLPFTATGGITGTPGGFVTPLTEGWETVINGSDRWKAFDPLHLLCNMEYRIAGGDTTTQLARPSMGLVYAPFERMSVTSSVGLALRSTMPDDPAGDGGTALKSADDDPVRHLHSGLEYGLILVQGFGQGYNVELDLSVEDVQPSSVADLDPSSPFGPTSGGMIFLTDGGTARKREMSLSLSKQFGRRLSGTLGTSFLDGEGDIMAIPAVPGDSGQWAEATGGNGRVRGVSGHFDTFLPTAGTGILVTYHHLTNLDSWLLDQNRSPAGEITGLDVGLRQRLLRTAGLDLQLLMAISGLALDENSFHGLVDSLIGDDSPYRRIVGGLRVHF